MRRRAFLRAGAVGLTALGGTPWLWTGRRSRRSAPWLLVPMDEVQADHLGRGELGAADAATVDLAPLGVAHLHGVGVDQGDRVDDVAGEIGALRARRGQRGRRRRQHKGAGKDADGDPR